MSSIPLDGFPRKIVMGDFLLETERIFRIRINVCMRMAFMRSFLIPAVIFLFAGCATVEPVHIDIASVPSSDENKTSFLERQLGETGYYYLVLNYKLVDQPSLAHRLRRLGTRITQYTERPNVEYKYLVIDSKYHNAFSMPDGFIVFTKAMIDRLETDEKIQAVMAHEVAHITYRHGTALYEKKFGHKNILGNDVISLATAIAYHQAFELQADQMALRYLYRAGLDPSSLIDTMYMLEELAKIDAEEFKKDTKQKVEAKVKKLNKIIMMLHPDVQNRIVNCRNYLETVRATEKVKYNPNDFAF